ncbi:MAG: AI-2E family transporter [Gammaproteobacteria bacterium]|jgi:predicted PurR-regulated permease PerM|nr:AI-2E family transporter [Gammaproteobacteria bacterium]MBT6073698.1 AI-2E family transporter [Gammaproteobacteria bacterium]
MKSKNAFIFVLSLITILFAIILWNFFLPILWAIVLSILFYPLRNYLINKKYNPSLVSFLTIIVIVILVLIPGFIIFTVIGSESLLVLNKIESGEYNLGQLVNWFNALVPNLIDRLDSIGLNTNQLIEQLNNIGVGATKFIVSLLMSTGQNLLQFFLSFFIMIYLLFFFLRDGENIIKLCIESFPMDDNQERFLIEKFSTVIKATVKGTILIAIAQGSIGGLILLFLDIEGAILWGAMMALFSILPGIGASIIWLPIALALIFNGALLKGLILIISGIFIIGLIDNLLRPYLVGKETNLPDYLILLSTLGGITIFGLSGFIIGPVVTALFIALWSTFNSYKSL